ncbi:TPA: hypothetical protein M4Y70_001719 [Klebsiella variicola]|uniref:hypothetical protein n=1 Tax=Klebsiella TaxID=570 RepID=UPI000D74930D|nr:hypothetical protein [Klebsiella variicola]UNA31146.1 hypothetical protein LOF14_23380 [Klebsiella variicola subsp. variicola]MBS3653025.1 hypothetical protein [Klebsiella variicola]MDT7003524.1 hypothetical protein [Klebsiella variicola]MDT7024927.1 hypothetical protein [Klebsiella variicola]PXH36449.1 hypothetical protein DMR13_03815 [Klebsiella variicola]
MHAKTGGEIIFLKTANYKKKKGTYLLHLQHAWLRICCKCNLYNLPEDKFILTLIWITAGMITDAIVSDKHEISNYDGSFINPAVVSSAEAS